MSEIESALSICFYDENNNEVLLAEISEGLHYHIFEGNVHPGKWGILSKIRDRYGKDVSFNRPQIEEFIKKLHKIKEFIPQVYEKEIDEIIKVLNNEQIVNIIIYGD
ncbi:hypothetical protein [Neobacillus niacini]|uniref:hypothetical protein n=1 Tax=Neobacillus niacini TaxID=86668 RepID=UPI003983061E